MSTDLFAMPPHPLATAESVRVAQTNEATEKAVSWMVSFQHSWKIIGPLVVAIGLGAVTLYKVNAMSDKLEPMSKDIGALQVSVGKLEVNVDNLKAENKSENPKINTILTKLESIDNKLQSKK